MLNDILASLAAANPAAAPVLLAAEQLLGTSDTSPDTSPYTLTRALARAQRVSPHAVLGRAAASFSDAAILLAYSRAFTCAKTEAARDALALYAYMVEQALDATTDGDCSLVWLREYDSEYELPYAPQTDNLLWVYSEAVDGLLLAADDDCTLIPGYVSPQLINWATCYCANALAEYADHADALARAAAAADVLAPYWLLELFVDVTPAPDDELWALFAVHAAAAVQARLTCDIVAALEHERFLEDFYKGGDGDALHAFYMGIVARGGSHA